MPLEPELTEAQMRAALRAAMAHARKSRRFTAAEASRVSQYAAVARAVRRLRPVAWPPGDELDGATARFILNISPQSFAQACREGRIPARKVGRFYYVGRAALKAHIRAVVADADKLGVPVPAAARSTVKRLGR